MFGAKPQTVSWLTAANCNTLWWHQCPHGGSLASVHSVLLLLLLSGGGPAETRLPAAGAAHLMLLYLPRSSCTISP